MGGCALSGQNYDQAVAGTPVPAEVLAQLVNVESAGNPNARNSSTGAFGLGQALPSTAANPGYGVAPLSQKATPQQQLEFSARYLAARGKALGMTDADWKNPQKVSAALAAYHGPMDKNGVNGSDYARKVLGMSASDTVSSLGAQPATSALGLSPYGPAMVSETVRQMDAAAKKKEQKTAPIYEEMRRNYERDQARFDKVADSYQPVKAIPQPTPPQNDPMKAFGSAAGMFAMLASAFTHTPAVNAMNGMAAAINASRAGDQQSYENAMKQWKENTEIAIQNHKLQADDMKAAMDMMQQDLTTGAAMAKAVAAQADDKIASRLAEQGEWDKLDEHMRASAKAALDMQIKLPEAIAAVHLLNARQSGDPNAITQAEKEYEFARTATAYGKAGAPLIAETAGGQFVLAQQMQNGQWVTADEKRTPIEGVKNVMKTDQAPSVGDPNVDKVAKQISEYKMAPLSGFVLKSPFGQAVMAKIGDINPEYQAGKYAARIKAIKDFSTGPQGKAVNSFNVTISHLDVLDKIVDSLNNGDIQTVNKLANSLSSEIGGTAPTNFNAAKQIVGQEIIKAIVGGGGGVAEREEAGQKLLSAQTPEQLRGVIDTYKNLMVGQLSGLKQQYEQNTDLKDFDQKLSPEAKAEFDKRNKGGDSSAESPTIPSQALSQLSEGHITIFGNGQKWTLRNGKPQQVQ